ncbi:hypothetical protein [Asaia bogorensis]|uniref:hypothetical protein n=1 Tax=Asaia bogorensis TaxID=91915 RepID=UPI001F092092|nr:hypothetical protein [Asaia bogorensis]
MPLNENIIPMLSAWADRFTMTTEGKSKEQFDVMRRGVELYSLLHSGTITQCHVVAAQSWASDVETGIIGAFDPERRSTGQGTLEDMLIARSATVAGCESVRRNLGRYAADLFVLDGLPVSRIAKIYDKNRRSMADAVALLLDQLSYYYDNLPTL